MPSKLEKLNSERKVLGSIQPDTPSRRSTFLVKPQIDNKMKSLSPLSFEKESIKKSNKSLVKPKTQTYQKNGENKENKPRRETFNVPNKEPATRNLFGTSKNRNTNLETSEADLT